MAQLGAWGSAVVVAAAVSLAVWHGFSSDETPSTDPLTISSYGTEGLHYGASEMQGKRSYMEDASDVLFVSREELGTLLAAQAGREQRVLPFALFGVFDGHGGSKTSTYLRGHLLRRTLDVCKEALSSSESSDILVEQLLKSVNVKTSSTSGLVDEHDKAVEACLLEAFIRVNAEYEGWAKENDSARWNRSGSTATVSLVYTVAKPGEESAWRIATANAGDSRGVLGCGGLNAVIELSIDHKPNDPAEKQRIEELGGTVTRASLRSPWRVEGILATSRSFGDFILRPFVNAVPDVRFHEVPSTDEEPCTLLLCSDGFWDVYSNEEGYAFAQELRQSQLSPKEVSERLLWTAYERLSSDNITTLVVYLDRLLPQFTRLLREVV